MQDLFMRQRETEHKNRRSIKKGKKL